MKSLLSRRNALTAVLAAALIAVPVCGQANDPHSLVGTWKVQVTVVTPGPFQFTAYNVFHADGTSVEFDNSNPPSTQTIAVGPWVKTGHDQFAYTSINQLFDNLGNFAGEFKLKAAITLDKAGNSFTSSFSFQVFDPLGNVVATGTGTAIGTRVTVEL
jgi:hypothetical protein